MYSLLKRKSFEHHGMKDTISIYVLRREDNYECTKEEKKSRICNSWASYLERKRF